MINIYTAQTQVYLYAILICWIPGKHPN